MHPHRYILQPYKGINSRHTCPSCRRRREFTCYIDTTTGAPLSPEVGKCNRASNCGYHYTPKQYFADHNIPKQQGSYNSLPRPLKRLQPATAPTSYIDPQIVMQSLQHYERNHFMQYLCTLFGADEAARLAGRYLIGTAAHWQGATVFWQVDVASNARCGKIMLYDAQTGKRVKQPYNHITWVHSALRMPRYQLRQCLFGEHLLRGNNQPAAIVESEKTAIIATHYVPQYIWLATGSLTNLTPEKCAVLKGRTVYLYPDLNVYDQWQKKAAALSRITRMNVSTLLEQKATDADREQGLDVADYLVREMV